MQRVLEVAGSWDRWAGAEVCVAERQAVGVEGVGGEGFAGEGGGLCAVGVLGGLSRGIELRQP